MSTGILWAVSCAPRLARPAGLRPCGSRPTPGVQQTHGRIVSYKGRTPAPRRPGPRRAHQSSALRHNYAPTKFAAETVHHQITRSRTKSPAHAHACSYAYALACSHVLSHAHVYICAYAYICGCAIPRARPYPCLHPCVITLACPGWESPPRGRCLPTRTPVAGGVSCTCTPRLS